MDDCRKRQTSTATPAEPGDLPWGLVGQHHLLHRVRRPTLRRRVKDMDRNGAVADDAGVLRRPWCEVGIGRRALDGLGRKIEFEVARVAENRLDGHAVDANE